MDTGKGTFEHAKSLEELFKQRPDLKKVLDGRPEGKSGLFTQGETLEIRGSKFKIQRITRRQLVLLLLPQE